MLKIKTILAATVDKFDELVNAAIADGWDLVKRDVLPPCDLGSEYYKRAFYAELEREEDDPEEDPEDAAVTWWETTRDPSRPFRCAICGFKTPTPSRDFCPSCRCLVIDKEGEG